MQIGFNMSLNIRLGNENSVILVSSGVVPVKL